MIIKSYFKMKLIFSILIFVVFSNFHLNAQNISQWRGANRDGIYEDTKLLKEWPESGPKLLWNSDSVGDGYGSPVINSGMLFINGGIDSICYLFAFNTNGKLLWKSPNGKTYVGQGFGARFPGSRSTPTIVDDLVYSCSGSGRIGCFEKLTGKEKWSADMQGDLKGFMNSFGYSESLVVDNDNVYCFPGGATNFALALNRFTGKPVWTSSVIQDTVSYCSPVIINLPVRRVLVTFTSNYLVGLDANTGKLLWSEKQQNVHLKQQCNTPLYSDKFLYYVAGDGNGAVKIDISDNGSNIRDIWRNPMIKNNFGGFVKLENYIYCTDQGQKLKCIDCNNGQTIDSISLKHGSIISAEGLLYCYSQNGEVSLIKPHEPLMTVISKFKIEKGTKEHFAHPVISNGILYIRHGRTLLAYDIKK